MKVLLLLILLGGCQTIDPTERQPRFHCKQEKLQGKDATIIRCWEVPAPPRNVESGEINDRPRD